MADRSLRTDDVPEFDTYPGRESRVVNPDRELPAETARRAENPKLNEAAQEIGRTAGRAVAAVREFPRRVEQAREDVRQKVRDLRAQSEQRGQSKIIEIKEQAGRRIEVLRNRAEERLYLARNRAQRLTRERPLELIVAAFAGAFLLGVALRIWRSNRG